MTPAPNVRETDGCKQITPSPENEAVKYYKYSRALLHFFFQDRKADCGIIHAKVILA